MTQVELAARLCEVDGNDAGVPSRDQVKRWESEKVIPGGRWITALSQVFDGSGELLNSEARSSRVKRRTFLAATGVVVTAPRKAELLDMLASVAGGDEGWLSRNIGPYDFSVSLANLANRDQGTKRRLVRWLEDGSTSLLRGNAQGTLFKTQHTDLVERAELSMRHDAETRARCMRCFTRRTFGLPWPEASRYTARAAPDTEVQALGRLLHDPLDASNRWCAAVYLGEAVEGGSTVARSLLGEALRTESSRENLRALGLAMNGERPWN
ncbi:hypothetical protein [Streptacidiphilus sp. PAMC 29251]